jgi:hypothetical protein
MRCDECGYDYNEVGRDEVAPRIRAFGPRYAEVLAGRAHDELRSRPAPDVWSPLEYACHLRDVFRAQRQRIALSLEQDTPEYPSMRRDERVLEERYNEQEPAMVLDELTAAADELARALEDLDDAGWQRTGIYSYPTRELRTLEWIGRHTIHEGEHHLLDVARQLT